MQHSGTGPADNLGEELSIANALLALLKQEQECLVNVDTEGLTKLSGAKAQAVARMSELAHRRHRSLASAGFDGREAGMQAWINSPSAPASAKKTWAELLEIARTSKELNRVNGLLINQQMSRNQGALNILQGNQQSGSVYGPNGQTSASPSSRKLVIG